MNDKIRGILQQLDRLEDELQGALHEQQDRVLYQIRGKRVAFERQIEEAHRELRMGVARWLLASRPLHVVSAPVIYAMIVPLALLDLCFSLYQAIAFRLYRIPAVDRSLYVVIDRHRLQYLNWIERFNCVYCGYANGVIAYVREIAARTEQFWCPIKHARRVLGSHNRYARFLEYGDAQDYPARLEELRERLRRESAAH